VQLQTQRLNLAALVRTTAEDLRAGLTQAALTLHVEVPDEPVFIDGDPTRLAQVIGNLLHNAGKFTPAGGGVTVRLEVRGSRAVTSVSDTGSGIDPAFLPTVFSAFTQEDRTLDRSKGGLGLGLALVKGLVELHHGEASAHSEGVGKGTTFTFSLPLANGRQRPDEPAVERAGARKLRVLVIEDNLDAAASVRMLLELYGHEVALAHSGPEGIEQARRVRPELILCDLGLPGASGYEVARTLRQEESLAGVKLVAVSGYGQPEDQRRASEAGFDEALVKPVSPEALRRLLAELT
jgi:two-component system CheB/CheR fusion protein